MSLSTKKSLRLFVFLGLLLARAASGQTDRATLEGTVTDPSGAVISGANVKATALATGIAYESHSNAAGNYHFPGLAVGEYTVEVSKVDFQSKIVQHVVLQVGENHTLDLQLQVGTLSERVEVIAADSPAERSSAEASTVIRADQIANLPVNGRGWAELTLQAPFAQDDGGGDQRTIRFAGRARDDNNFTFDGADATGIQEQAPRSQTRLQISEDAVAEYRVNSALYDAEYGTQSGGQINVVTKSGTNEFHGTVFGYLRNSVFDARNFNDPPIIPPFRLGQYGMTLGGPIIREKTFFFLSYEGLRQLQEVSTAGAVFVPSASLIKAILVTGRDGLGPSPQMCAILQGFPWRQSTGTVGGCTPKVVFPDSAFSPLAPDQLSQLTLDPTDQPSDFDAFTHNIRTTVHEDTWLFRIDHKFSDKTSVYARAQRDISLVYAQIGVTAGIDASRGINHPANYLLALQHAFSANLFNEGKLYVNRSPSHGIGVSTLPFVVGTNNFAVIPNRLADNEIGTTYGILDNLTWTRDRHAFKTGIEIRRIRLNQGMTAQNQLTFSDDDSLVSASLSGINFIASWCCHRLRRSLYMPYFQDEWKVTPALTVTAGLRWEYYGVAHEATNRTTVFDFDEFHGACLGSGSFNTPYPKPINTPPCPRNPPLYNPNYRNFDPRISLAWAPSALRDRTVFRGGFGIYHGAAQNDDLNAGLESDTFRISIVPSNGTGIPLVPAYEQESPDLSNFPKTGQQPRALQRHGRRDLYAEEWGLTLDHQLPAGFLFSASYLGSHGVRLFSRGAVNLCTKPVFVFSDSNGSANCARPLDGYFPDANPADPAQTLDPYGSVDIKRDIGSSTYHALGLLVERRFDKSLSFQGRYTLSHSINDGSVGGGESNGPEDVNCLRCDKGPSIFDIRHNFTANAAYELPFGPGKMLLSGEGIKGKVIGGWQLSGTGIWHTGHPLTVNMLFLGSQTFLLPDGNDQTFQRPDVIPGVPLTLPGGGHNGLPLINAAAFQSPPVDANGNFTRFGNAGNGIISALPTWQVDLALTKETKLSERYSLQFATQAFNVFNHTQLGDPIFRFLFYSPTPANPRMLATPPGFGVLNSTVNFNKNNDNFASPNTGTGLPRQIQFMLRLRF